MNIWQDLTQNESLLFILYHFIAFLIGLLTGYLIWGRKLGALKLEIEGYLRRIKELEGENADLRARLGVHEADIKRLGLELGTANGKIDGLEVEKGDLHTTIIKMQEAERGMKLELSGANDKLKLATTNFDNARLEINQWSVKTESAEAKLADAEAALKDCKAKYAELSTQKENDLKAMRTKMDALQLSLTESQQSYQTALGAANDTSAMDSLKADYESQLSTANAKLGELSDLRIALNKANTEKSELETELENLKASLDGSNADMNATLNQAEEARLSLQAKVDGLEKELESAKAELGVALTDKESTDAELSSLKATVASYSNNVADGASNEEMSKLRADLNDALGKLAEYEDNTSSRGVNLAASPLGSSDPSAIQAAADLKEMMGSAIPTATADEADDLKLIKGIGKFIEEKLNKLGIYQFLQIAYFDRDIIKKVTDAIEFFPGRIERDQWVRQARQMTGLDKIQSAEEAKAEIQKLLGTKIPAATKAEADDLTQIKGIGAGIQEKLYELGIFTLRQISMFDAEMVDNVGDALEVFQGRIERDEWVRQAEKLVGTI